MIRFTQLAILVMALVITISSAFAGNISGKVAFTGPQPQRPMINMQGDKSCAQMHGGGGTPSEMAIVNSNGTLKNVFVYVKGGLSGTKYPAPAEPAHLDQQGCMYTPRVLGMQTGQPLEIVNSDQVIHNVHALPKNSQPFNLAQPKKGRKDVKTFTKPEVMVKIKCDVHPWMAAWVGVLDHPFFAVTGDQGSFEIKNLPPGEYELEAWHEKFGVRTLKVKVAKTDVKNADFSYSAK